MKAKPIGYYKWVVFGGHNATYTTSPFYGKRYTYLSSIHRSVLQIQVYSHNELIWININPEQLV